MQFRPRLRFFCSTILASVGIALARLVALLKPIRAIIRFISAAPTGIILAARMLLIPISMTAKTTEDTLAPIHYTRYYKERYAALLADAFNLSIGRMVDTTDIYSTPLTITLHGAKVIFAPLNLMLASGKWLSAIITEDFSGCSDDAKIADRIDCCRAFVRTKLAWPTSIIPKALSTLGTVYPDTRSSLLAIV